MLTNFYTRSVHYKHPELSVACKIYEGKRVVSWSHETQNLPGTKPFWKMANFKPDYLASKP